MFKLITNVYGSITALTTLLSLASKETVSFATEYLQENKDLNQELNKHINLRKVEKILSKIQDVQDMDIPQDTKDLAIAKLQTILANELAPTA